MTTLSHAQCSKDTDCKGDRVCEAGSCVNPPARPPPAAVAAPAATPPAGSAAAAPVAAPQRDLAAEEPHSTAVVDTRRKPRRHSTGMMAGGIVMVSFAPIALLAAWVADIEQGQCENGFYDFGSSQISRGTNCDRYDPTIYGGLISAAVLTAVGIPLIIVGSKREPLGSAKLTPWATPRAGGLSLRLEL